MTITEQESYVDASAIAAWFKAEYKQLVTQWGDPGSIPREDRQMLDERLRAKYVVLTAGMCTPEVLTQYSVPPRIIEEMCGTGYNHERRPKREDKVRAVEEWIADHVGEEIAPTDIAEAFGVSYPTAMKVINDRPGVFVRVSRGKYSVNDIAAQREAERNG